jgi:glutamate-5-semialdehyde dehydrogenase
MKEIILKNIQLVKTTARHLVNFTDDQICSIVLEVAASINENIPTILAENAKDLAKMPESDPKFDRLLLNSSRLKSMVSDMQKVANLPSPIGQIIETKTLPNGLHLQKIRVALGVLGIVYESRPNVTLDVFCIAIKSGNALVLKGSQDAQSSNECLVTILQKVLQKYDLQHIVYLMPAGRAHLVHLLEATKLVDCIIPRGSQGLIDYVRENSKVPVIETGAGVVHIYYDASADPEKSKEIITNAKARRVSVCNALDCLVIHQNHISDLPFLLHDLIIQHNCTIYADADSFDYLDALSNKVYLAENQHFGKEFLSMAMSIKTVQDIHEAVDFIAQYSSKHSECILSEDQKNIDYFTKNVDAAVVYVNASTSFTDGGEFGMGAEIGISTQKLHARGPMALSEMTSYKWIAIGNGQIR